MITPLRIIQAPVTPTIPTRGKPPPPESPVRIVQLFPGGESDEFDSFSEYVVKQKDKATYTVMSDVEVFEVRICSIEDEGGEPAGQGWGKAGWGKAAAAAEAAEKAWAEAVEEAEAERVAIEERVDMMHSRVIKLEKNILADIDIMNRLMMIINIAMFSYLVVCFF